MTTNAFRVWFKRLDSGILTRSQARQFAAAISPVTHGEDARGKRTALTYDESVTLCKRLRGNPARLTEEDTEYGLTWLREHANRYQRAGGLGMSSYLRNIVLDRFGYFSFDGEYVASDAGIYPVWTINLKDVAISHLVRAERLHYYAVPWQSRTDENYSDYWWEGER